jgi:hypothetical protein
MKRQWFKDFGEFLHSKDDAPSSLKNSILSKIKKDLQPSFSSSFQKFILSQALAGISTLFICPQFGIAFFNNEGHHFVHSIMAYGHWACAAFCASIFMGFASLITYFVLSRFEMRVLRKKWPVVVTFPPTIYLLVFIIMRNPQAMHSDFYISNEFISTWYVVAVTIAFSAIWLKTRPTRTIVQ